MVRTLVLAGSLAILPLGVAEAPASGSRLPSVAPTRTVIWGVSCTTGTHCTGVGSYGSSTASVPLAEVWNGTKWVVRSTPNPTGGVDSVLRGVSCTSASSCVAVGSFTDYSYNSTLFVEGLVGTTWGISNAPLPAGTESFLSGVSCTSSTRCIAVGGYQNGGAGAPLAERWNGTKWAILTTPSPTGATGAYLRGVSCASSTACTAVGYSAASTTYKSLVERWNGTTWKIQASPNAAGTAPLVTEITAVSCATTTSCAAVGYSDNADSLAAVAETWNGTTWKIRSTPNPTGVTVTLDGVSCRAASACIAVGYSGSSTAFKSIVEVWNGTKWTVQRSPNPSGSTATFLYGASCKSSAACTAVGQAGSQTAFSSLSERWNGTTWSIQPMPVP